LCYGITAIIAFVLLIRNIGIPQFSWHWTFSKAIAKKSLPYALLILLMMIYTRSDSIILERIHPNGNVEAGIYAQGYRLLDAFFIFGMIFSNLLFPLFSKLFKRQESIIPLLRTGGNLLIGGAILIVSFCYFNSKFIMSLIYENNIDQSIPSFKWLMLSFIGMCFSLIFGTLLTAQGSLRVLNKYSFLTILVNVGLNVILIPKMGAEGAAITTFCTQTFIALIQFFYCAKVFQFEFSVLVVNRYLLFVISILLIYLTLNYYPLGKITFVVEIALSTFALFIFKMIDFRALKEQFLLER
jgi:O-antigen/teichoic acid export membrane protein